MEIVIMYVERKVKNSAVTGSETKTLTLNWS